MLWKGLTSAFAEKETAGETFFRLNRIALLIVFFCCSLFLRVLSLGRDLFGDESYYYYLSRFPSEYAVYHYDHPPMLYLSYHLFTADIVTFRAVNAIVGSFIPCLVYMILTTYNIRERYRILGASLPVFYMIFVKYSTVVFLDMLCAFFFLIGVYFYRRGRWRLTDLFFGLSILTKEVAILGVAVFMGYLVIKRRSIRFVFPLITLSVSVVFLILIPFEGWKRMWYGAPHGVFEEFFLFSITPAFLPLLAILIYRRYFVESLFFAIYPLAFFMYQTTSDWYSVLPLSFNMVSIMVALNEIHNLNLSKRSYIRYILLIFFVSNIALSSYHQAFATHSFVNYRPRNLQDVTHFLIENYRGRRLLMIDCFWGYRLYPFGTYLKVVRNAYTGHNHMMRHYTGLINEIGLAVIGTLGEKAVNHTIRRSLFQLYANNVVFKNSEYTMIDLSRNQSTL